MVDLYQKKVFFDQHHINTAILQSYAILIFGPKTLAFFQNIARPRQLHCGQILRDSDEKSLLYKQSNLKREELLRKTTRQSRSHTHLKKSDVFELSHCNFETAFGVVLEIKIDAVGRAKHEKAFLSISTAQRKRAIFW